MTKTGIRLGVIGIGFLLLSCVPQGKMAKDYLSSPLIQSPEISGDFGTFNQLQQGDKIFTFAKDPLEEISEQATVSLNKGLNGSGFEVIAFSGCERALEERDRCFVRVRFSGKIYKDSLVSEVKTAILTVGSVSIPLVASYDPLSSGDIEVSGNENSLAEQMDLECVDTRCDLILKFTNKSLISQTATGLSVPSGYLVLYNSCSKVLAPSKSCLVRLRVEDQVGDLAVGEISLNSNGETISSSVRIIREFDTMSPSVSMVVDDAQEIDNEIYFLGSSATLRLSLSDDRLERGVQYSLSSGLTCATTSWSELSPDSLKIETLTLQSGVDNSFSVKVRDAIGNESSCVPLLVKNLALKSFLVSITQPLPGKGSISGPSSALGGSSAEYSYVPAIGYKALQWLGDCSTNGNGNCILNDIRSNKNVSISLTCDNSYHAEGLDCLYDTRSCFIENGTGSQSWTGTEWGSCSLVSCNATYHVESGACFSDTRVCSITNGTGSQSWTGSAWGSCGVTACNATYHIESGACFSDTRVCAITNGSGSQTWTGTTWGSCGVTSCNSSYHIEGGACQLNTQTCSLAGTTNCSKVWQPATSNYLYTATGTMDGRDTGKTYFSVPTGQAVTMMVTGSNSMGGSGGYNSATNTSGYGNSTQWNVVSGACPLGAIAYRFGPSDSYKCLKGTATTSTNTAVTVTNSTGATNIITFRVNDSDISNNSGTLTIVFTLLQSLNFTGN